MKKPVLLGVAVALTFLVAGALAWWLMAVSAPGPRVARVLSAKDSMGFLGFEGLDGVVRRVDTLTASLPAELRAPLPAFLDPTKRKDVIGFDPSTAAGWQGIGIDPEAGVAIAADDRLIDGRKKPNFVGLVRITDRERLSSWLTARLGHKPPAAWFESGVHPIELPGSQLLAGERQGWTFLSPLTSATDAAKNGENLKKLLTDDGPTLDRDASFRVAFDHVPTGWRGLAYLHADGLLAAAKAMELPETTLQIAAYEAHLFRSFGLYTGDSTGARLSASTDGVDALRKLLLPVSKAPDFTKWMPRSGWLMLQLSVNLKDAFDGVTALIPSQMTEARGAVAAGRMFMPLALGFGWDDLVQAFSGHLLVAVQVDAKGSVATTPAWRVALAVQDPKAADALVEKLKGLAVKRGATVTATPIGSMQGFTLSIKGIQAVGVRQGDLLWLASDAQVLIAGQNLSSSESLTGTEVASALEPETVFALISGALAAPQSPAAGAALTVRLDAHGLLAQTHGNPGQWQALAALIGQSFLRLQRAALAPSAAQAALPAPATAPEAPAGE